MALALGAFYFSLTSPVPVKAGFLSLLGRPAEAQNPEELSGLGSNFNANSQTLALLQANAAPAKETATGNKSKEEPAIDYSTDVNISGNALMPSTGPADATGNGEIFEALEDESSIYVVHQGDTIGTIAAMFGVSTDTILTANDLQKGAKLKTGDVLLILPISGVEHTVAKGETLAGIAKKYKIDSLDIILYNGLPENPKLALGAKLMIPGGSMVHEGGDKPAANLNSQIARDKNYYSTSSLKNALGYFINPLKGAGRKTQGLHGPGKRGIDIGAPTGTPIYAAASGSVLIAKTGWSGGYGNMAILQHPNGTKTLYAHMTKLGTSTGASVAQGEIIGYVGSTGHSTGPHLHFEVFNAKNPGADWSWK